MNFANVKSLKIPEGEVKEIRVGGVLLWKSGYTNLVPLSTTEDDKTIYNGVGYKNGYRIRSGGAEGSDNVASHTGFIKIKGGDVIRMSGYDALIVANANAINVYDASHAVLGQVTSGSANYGYGFFQSTWKEYNWGLSKGVKEEKSGVYIWTAPPDTSIAYMRVTGYTNKDGSKMIVTVNEEIE